MCTPDFSIVAPAATPEAIKIDVTASAVAAKVGDSVADRESCVAADAGRGAQRPNGAR